MQSIYALITAPYCNLPCLQTIHGEVYNGICLRCNPSPNLENVKLSHHGLGWQRTIRATDFKLRWERSSENITCKSNNNWSFDIAYARKVEFLGSDRGGGCPGQVTLVPFDISAVDSVLECSNGRTVVSYSDIDNAQKLNLEGKTEWFRDALARYCGETGGRTVRVSVRQKHMLEDSLEAVMALSRAEMRRAWALERERELGELTKREWYKSVIEQLFMVDAGLWQKCSADETRMEINILGGEHVHADVCLPTYHSFLIRPLTQSSLS